MSNLSSITDTWIWYTLCICALVLFVGSFTVVFRSVKDRRKKMPILLNILNLILIAVLNVIFMDCGHAVRTTTTQVYSQFQRTLFDIPYYVYVLSEIMSCVVLLSLGYEGSQYRSDNITTESIQQAVDVLPEGIAVCGVDGTVRLSNLKINKLCRSMTGKILTDANKFWTHVEKEGKEQGGKYLVRVNPDKVWLLEKELMTVKGKQYVQIIAADVTERYAIIEELERKNEHLQDIQRRMKAVSDLSGDMFVAQEEADARAALHNQLGQVLLMGRHYINHQDTTDPKVVYLATRQMNQFLLGESEEPYNGEENELALAISMAGSIGVKIEIFGEELKDKDLRKILAQAITECAANTVKHAEGDIVRVECSDNEITITNNGKPPKDRITESGGLLSLRRNVESSGGEMLLESEPVFKLTLKIQANQKNGTNG